jgi:hypothetical protein
MEGKVILSSWVGVIPPVGTHIDDRVDRGRSAAHMLEVHEKHRGCCTRRAGLFRVSAAQVRRGNLGKNMVLKAASSPYYLS